jgi:hypothetical protein
LQNESLAICQGENAMASPSSTSASTSSADRFPSTDWSQPTLLSEVMQQKGLLIGLGLTVVAFLVLARRRSAPETRAVRRLVRDWRRVDDIRDARDLLGSNLPTVVRPVLLVVLGEIERQVHRGFDNIERDIRRL